MTPTALLIACQLLLVFGVPIALGAVLGFRRARRLSVNGAACRGCGATLPFAAAALDGACPGCGKKRDETGPLQPRVAKRPRLPFAILVLLLLLLWVGAGAGSVIVMRQSMSSAPWNRTTATILNSAMRLNQSLSMDIPTLREREAAGEDVVGAARNLLAAALAAPSVPGVDGTDSGNAASDPPTVASLAGTAAPEVAAIALRGVPGGLPSPPADPTLASRVLLGCFPRLDIEPTSLRVTRPVLRPSYTGFVNPGGPLQRIAVIRALRVDGQEITDQLARGAVPVRLFAADNPLALNHTFDAGQHTLELDLELRLYSHFDAQRITDHRGLLRPIESWPEPLATATQTVRSVLPAATSGSP